MTRNTNEPREALTPGVREDQAADGSRSAVTVAHRSDIPQQGLSARPLVLVTRGRVEFTAKCPGCDQWHRHRHLGDVRGPCGTQYELQPRRGRARGK